MAKIPLQLPLSQRTDMIPLKNPTLLQVATVAALLADVSKKVTKKIMKILEPNSAYKAKCDSDFLHIVNLVIKINAENIRKTFYQPV